MKNLRIWATELSLIIMITGIIMKIIPQKSERGLLRLVSTMIIFTFVFQTNFKSFSLGFDNNIKSNIENKSENFSNKISEHINKIFEKETEKSIKNEIYKCDKEAKVRISFEENKLKVYIDSRKISQNEIYDIEERIKNEFECEFIIIKAGESVDG